MGDKKCKPLTDGFRLLSSYYEAIRPLPDEERLMLYDAVWDFGFLGEEPENLPPLVNAVFIGLRENIRNSVRHYEKQTENGRKGGRPPKTQNPTETQTKPNENPNETQPKPKVSKTKNRDSESESESDSESACESANRAGEARDARTPPTVEDVVAYITEHGLEADAQSFYDYYTARDWRDGNGRPFKDWTALLRRWASNGYDDKRRGKDACMETLQQIYSEEAAKEENSIVSVQTPQEHAALTDPFAIFKEGG